MDKDLYLKNKIYFLNIYFFITKIIAKKFGDWGLGIGDWGLGIGDWGLGPIPNPQSPIPNPQSPFKLYFFSIHLIILYHEIL